MIIIINNKDNKNKNNNNNNRAKTYILRNSNEAHVLFLSIEEPITF